MASNAASVQALYQQIKLALDVYAGDLMVVRMVDGGTRRVKFSVERLGETGLRGNINFA